MRLRLDAAEGELVAHGEAFIRALSAAVAPHSPELAEQLAKALPAEAPGGPRDPVIEGLRAEFVEAYQRQMVAMNRDIARVLDQSVGEVAKSAGCDEEL